MGFTTKATRDRNEAIEPTTNGEYPSCFAIVGQNPTMDEIPIKTKILIWIKMF